MCRPERGSELQIWLAGLAPLIGAVLRREDPSESVTRPPDWIRTGLAIERLVVVVRYVAVQRVDHLYAAFPRCCRRRVKEAEMPSFVGYFAAVSFRACSFCSSSGSWTTEL